MTNGKSHKNNKQNKNLGGGNEDKNAKNRRKMGVAFLTAVSVITLGFLAHWIFGLPVSPTLISILGVVIGMGMYMNLP